MRLLGAVVRLLDALGFRGFVFRAFVFAPDAEPWVAPFVFAAPVLEALAPVCLTTAIRSSGKSDASVLASFTTPLACRAKKSLLTNARSATPDAVHRKRLPPLCRLPCAASATSDSRVA